MNRLEFFLQVRKDLTQTFKEVAYPLLQYEVEKIDKTMDTIAGVHWYELKDLENPNFEGVRDYHFDHVAIEVFSDGEEIKAVGRECLACHSFANWIAYEKFFKCMTCEGVFSLDGKKRNLPLRSYPVKKKDNKWVVGIPKNL